MRDYVDLGSAPYEEPCANVGEPDYQKRARVECNRFVDFLRKTFGPEPPGATLRVKSNPHDFGSYLSVVCEFDDRNEAAAEYAYRCEDDTPATWPEPEPEAEAQPKKLDVDRVMAAVQADEGLGFCLACGEEVGGCEPDARNYPCPACSKNRVFGAEEVLLMVAF